MEKNKNNFDINLNGAQTLAGASVASNKQTEYINLNCYIQRAGDETPEWVFRASCVPTTRKATESILKKIAMDMLNNKKKAKQIDEVSGEIIIVETDIPQPITFSFIEGNMKKEKEEMEELF